jgi:type I restriction enzyme M protein
VGRGRQFRANSGLKSQEYSSPVLGLIFLRFAEVRFAAQRAKLEKAGASSRRGSRVDEPAAYHAERVVYLPPEARFDYLLNRPEGEDIGAKVNDAMRGVERHNPQLAGVLPKSGGPWPAYWAPLATRLMRRKQPFSSAECPDWNERSA